MSTSTENSPEIYDDESLLDQAFEIFMELAPENLPESTIAVFNQSFNDFGVIELYQPDDDWESYVDIPVDPQYLAEVVIGLKEHEQDDVYQAVFARILITREIEEKFCHILWNEAEDE